MDFINDDEKMRDYFLLTKDEFLESYKYLSENDYNETQEIVKRQGVIELDYRGEDDKNRLTYVSKGGYIYKDIALGKNNNLRLSLYKTVDNEFYGEPLEKINQDIVVKVLHYVPIKEIRGNEDLHKIAQMIKFETDDNLMPEDTKRDMFLRELETQIEWELDMLLPSVDRDILVQAHKEILQIKENEIASFKDKVENFLKQSEDYNEFKVEYILIDNEKLSNSFVIATNYDEMIQINPYDMYVRDIADWAYNFDDDIFKELEEKKEISYMSMEMHYNIWNFLEEYYPEEVDCIKGTQLYLKYCKENNITKERIDKENNFNDTPNAMKYYETIKMKDKEAR